MLQEDNNPMLRAPFLLETIILIMHLETKALNKTIDREEGELGIKAREKGEVVPVATTIRAMGHRLEDKGQDNKAKEDLMEIVIHRAETGEDSKGEKKGGREERRERKKGKRKEKKRGKRRGMDSPHKQLEVW